VRELLQSLLHLWFLRDVGRMYDLVTNAMRDLEKNHNDIIKKWKLEKIGNYNYPIRDTMFPIHVMIIMAFSKTMMLMMN